MRIRAILAALGASCLISAAGMMVTGAAPAAASTTAAVTAAPASTAHHGTKSVQTPPPNSPGIALGSAIPAKPSEPHSNVARPDINGWSLTLTASSTNLWPTQYTTLTATANMDVGPTPYYIRIYAYTGDGWPSVPGSPGYVASCGFGTTCTVSVTEPISTEQIFYADIAAANEVPPDTYPGGASEQYLAPPVYVLWQSISVSLAADPTTTGVGDSSTLTATASTDVGPTPFYIEIYDTTTDTFLTPCGSGTTCSETVSQSSATTHSYVAYVSDFGEGFPPPAVQATSGTSFVTWNGGGLQVTLSGPSVVFDGGPGVYTASTNSDVGPTPYFIEIYDETTDTLLARCGSGTSCTADYTPDEGGETLVAFVDQNAYGGPYPPTNIQASSNTLTTSDLIT
ncbi:MAG TPA: hypothetical protein VGM10_17070 [Actinocrinis sp.]|jgi:hypothetical protein